MRSRRFRIAFLWFLGLWFGIVVPGHQRGQITLPGGTAGMASCCPATPNTHCSTNASDNSGKTSGDTSGGTSGRKPSKSDQQRCAMCQYIATLLTPPPLLLDPPPHQPLAFQHRGVQRNLRPLGLAIGSVPGRSPPPPA